MTSHLRYARAALLTAATLSVFTIPAAAHGWWILAGWLLYGAILATAVARREHYAYWRLRAEAQRAERMARPYHPEPPPLTPCCLLWAYSRGAVHDEQRCTRPAAERGHLTPVERRAFQQITDRYHDTQDTA